MARPIGFDLDKAIDKATLLFWKKGYSNTSLRELLKVMGIGEGSFYNTVKSKKNLYLLCLQHYNSIVGRRRLAALESGSTASESVRAFFRTVLDELDDLKMPRVCLLAGSMSSDVLAERELKASVIDEMRHFEQAFVQRLRTAVIRGDLPSTFSVEAVAQLLVTYLQGLFRLTRILHTRADSEHQIDVLLRGLGL